MGCQLSADRVAKDQAVGTPALKDYSEEEEPAEDESLQDKRKTRGVHAVL